MTNTRVSAEEKLRAFSKERTDLLRLLREEKSRQARKITPYPRVDGAPLPTSWAQQRLWFIDQLERGTAAYNTAVAVRLRGSLDEEALQTALDILVQRHEVLRTVFVSADGDPTQVITAAERFVLNVIDLRRYEETEREAQLQRHKIEEVQGKFNLLVGPLIRGRLIRVQAREYVLLLMMHHIICDGWSKGVLIRELAELYRAHREGRGDPLERLPIQYADYAQWQRRWLQGKKLEKQLSYWRLRLEGIPPQLELPTDRPRPSVQSYRGDDVPVTLDAQLSAELRAFAQRHEMTLFMVLSAGWAILLSRLSGQDDIAIGTPVDNRQRPELEGLIGLFVNTLVLRVGAQGDLRVEELLDDVRKVALEAFEHQDVPFEQVVEALGPQRSLSRNPLFQVMFGLQTAPKTEVQLPGLVVTAEEEVCESSSFDLQLQLQERGAEIIGTLNYATDLFDRETVKRWVACFTVVLRGMMERAQSRIGELPILPESERRRIVDSFNATRRVYSRDNMIHQLVEAQAERTPDAVALVYEAQSLTYAELNRRANQLARYLKNKGVGPDKLVALCVERGLDLVVGLLGILKAGGAYVPLDPAYPSERLVYMLEDAAPEVLLTQERVKERLPITTAAMIALDKDWDEIALQPVSNLDAGVLGLHSGNLAYVIYTSGSTGRPKGVMVEHRSVVNLLRSMQELTQIEITDRLLAVTTLAFDIAALELYLPLICGARVVMAGRDVVMDPIRLSRLVDQAAITVFQATPATWRMLIESGWTSVVPVKALCGGEALSSELALKLRERVRELWNVYGPTETTIWSTIQKIGATEKVNPAQSSAQSIGRPIANTQIYILDRCHTVVPIGVVGEIYIGGAGVARGYLNRPDMTAERFIADPSEADPRARLYKTGDLARWRADGTIEYLGRNDHQVKLRGYRIELEEIEVQLARHEYVREVVVVAREDVPGEKRLVAYIVPKDQDGSIPSAEALRSHLMAVLPEYMVPSAFVALQQLPLTPNRKLDRSALPTPGLDAYVNRQYEAPQGEIEEVLAGIWQALLRVEQVGRQDNFFELGGHSLQGLKVIAKIAERFQVDLPGTAVFQYPTIQQMANVVTSLRRSHEEPRGRITVPPEAAIRANSAGIGLDVHRPQPERVPLAYSQLAHWNLFQLSERRSLVLLTSATRVCGRLHIGLLRKSLTEIIQRHAALRTRIIVCDGIPFQEISESDNCEFNVDDLTMLGESLREVEVKRLVDRFMIEPIDVTVGPLFKVRLIRLRHDEHVVVVGAEHIICDAYSINILWRDLFTTYVQALKGHASSLPAIGAQFSDYAVWQQTTQKSWVEKHRSYWDEHLAVCQRLRFPTTESLPTETRFELGSVPIQIGKELKAELREWSRLRGTTMVMSVFAAYVGLVLRWCNASEAVIKYQSDGRFSPELENTIGFFASVLYPRIELLEDDSFIDLTKRVTGEYCKAHEHADFFYLQSQVPRPEFTRNTSFNWIPQATEIDLADLDGSEDVISCSRIPFMHPKLQKLELDHEPAILLYDVDDEVFGWVYFPLNRFSVETMERFAHSFLVFIKALLRRPEGRVKDVLLV